MPIQNTAMADTLILPAHMSAGVENMWQTGILQVHRYNIPIGSQLDIATMAQNGLAVIAEAIMHTRCTPVRMDGPSGHDMSSPKETSTGRRAE